MKVNDTASVICALPGGLIARSRAAVLLLQVCKACPPFPTLPCPFSLSSPHLSWLVGPSLGPGHRAGGLEGRGPLMAGGLGSPGLCVSPGPAWRHWAWSCGLGLGCCFFDRFPGCPCHPPDGTPGAAAAHDPILMSGYQVR